MGRIDLAIEDDIVGNSALSWAVALFFFKKIGMDIAWLAGILTGNAICLTAGRSLTTP
jgi:hypothetical protein